MQYKICSYNFKHHAIDVYVAKVRIYSDFMDYLPKKLHQILEKNESDYPIGQRKPANYF